MKQCLITLRKGMNTFLSVVAAVLLSFMTLLVLYQVFTRYVLNNPAAFTEELVRYCLMWTGFVGAAYAFSTRQHMALFLVLEKLPDKSKRMLQAFIDLLILLFALFVITIGGAKLALSAIHVYSALIGISRGLVYSVAPICGVLIILAQCINLYEDITGTKLEGGTTV